MIDDAHLDPDVESVERLLQSMATEHRWPPDTGEQPSDGIAVWFCACWGEELAPTWLLFDLDDGVGWCRVPDRVDLEAATQGRRVTGDHVAARWVLDWLTGEDNAFPDADQALLADLRGRLTVST